MCSQLMICPGISLTSNSPYKFEAPWHAFEFAFHVLEVESNLVIVSMAWMTREERRRFTRMPNEPDMDTLTYWVTRLEPLIRSENQEEIIVVFCNRSGIEDEATYAGTSAVIGIQDGEVKVYGLLGRGEKELLVVDTNNAPYAKMVYRPESDASGKRTETLFQKPTPSDLTTLGERISSARGLAAESNNSIQPRCPTSEEVPPPPLKPVEQAQVLSSPASKASSQFGQPITHGRRHAPSIMVPPLPGLSSAADSRLAKPLQTDSSPASAHSSTPIAVRPRLIIPLSPSTLPYQYTSSEQPISATSEMSERSVQSVKSNESEASTRTIRSNPRPPEDSTPYPHSGMPLSGYPSNSLRSEMRIYGGDVRITHPNDNFNPTTPFDDVSPVSPRWVWRSPDDAFSAAIANGPLVPGTPLGRKPEPFLWSALNPGPRPVSRNDKNDRSENSDPASLGVRQHNSQSPQSNTSSNKTRTSRSAAGTPNPNAAHDDQNIARPSSPKSRNASRSGMRERSKSSLGQPEASSSAILHQLGQISQRAESRSRMHAESSNATPVPGQSSTPKPRASSQNRVVGKASHPHDQQQTIHIAASPSILETGLGRPMIPTPVAHEYYRRPMIQIGHQRSNSVPSHTTPNEAFNPHPGFHHPIQSTSAKPDIQRPSSRAASRGRQPKPKPSPADTTAPDPGSERATSADSTRNGMLHTRIGRRHCQNQETQSARRPSQDHGSRQGRRSSQGQAPVEFERVEVISCPNCPVHGRQSLSDGELTSDTPPSLRRLPPSEGLSPKAHSEPETFASSSRHSERGLDDVKGHAAAGTASSGVITAPIPNKSAGLPVTKSSTSIPSVENLQAISRPERRVTMASFNPMTPRAMAFFPGEVTVDSASNDLTHGSNSSAGRCADETDPDGVEAPTNAVAETMVNS